MAFKAITRERTLTSAPSLAPPQAVVEHAVAEAVVIEAVIVVKASVT
jgi:hypothetical protein